MTTVAAVPRSTSASFHQLGAAAAAFFAGIVSSGAVLLFVNSMMLVPVTHEFAWGRATFGISVLVSVLSNAVGVVVAGILADRFGVRRIVLPGIVLYALAMAAMALSNAATFMATFAVLGFFAATQGPQLYNKVISAWFTRRRGLALAIIAVGGGFGGVIWPLFVRVVNDHYGWRIGYVGLGIAILVLAFPMCVLFLREPNAGAVSQHERSLAVNEWRGMERNAVLRTRTFWLLTISQALSTLVFAAVLTNSVVLITSRGFSMTTAQGFLALGGLGAIIGRLVSGSLLDAVHSPRIAIAFFAAPLVALLMLGGSAPVVALAGGVLGLGFGSENEIAGYFFSRYFGLRAYAQTFSISFAIFALGAGLGPVITGRLFDTQGDYHVAVLVLEAITVISVALVALLGPYVYGVGAPVNDEPSSVAAIPTHSI